MLVGDAQEQFTAWMERNRSFSPHTVRAYASDLSILVAYTGPASAISDMSGSVLVGFVDAQKSEGLSVATVRRRVAASKAFCKWLIDSQLIDFDPWAGQQLRWRQHKKLPRNVPASDLGRLLESLCSEAGVWRDPRGSAPLYEGYHSTTLVGVLVMLATGVRVGELVAVRCSDIDLQEQSIRIMGKGSRERNVFVSDAWLLSLLDSYLTYRSGLGLLHGYLLFNSRGFPLTTAAMRRRLHATSRRAGLERKVTPHMIRHSAATTLIESGVDIRFVQRLLGHSSLATTEKYTHVADPTLRRVMFDARILERCMNDN